MLYFGLVTNCQLVYSFIVLCHGLIKLLCISCSAVTTGTMYLLSSFVCVSMYYHSISCLQSKKERKLLYLLGLGLIWSILQEVYLAFSPFCPTMHIMMIYWCPIHLLCLWESIHLRIPRNNCRTQTFRYPLALCPKHPWKKVKKTNR